MINVDGNNLNKTIGELRLNDLYSELQELNYKEPVSLYYGYARFMSIVSCSNRIAMSVKRKLNGTSEDVL